jgi:hypothetical protein
VTPVLAATIVHRKIVSRGVDARGEYAILECGHKIRKAHHKKRTPDAAETTRRCTSCEHRSPYR